MDSSEMCKSINNYIVSQYKVVIVGTNTVTRKTIKAKIKVTS